LTISATGKRHEEAADVVAICCLGKSRQDHSRQSHCDQTPHGIRLSADFTVRYLPGHPLLDHVLEHEVHGLVAGMTGLRSAQIGDDPTEDGREDAQDKSGELRKHRLRHLSAENSHDLLDRPRRSLMDEDSEEFLGYRKHRQTRQRAGADHRDPIITAMLLFLLAAFFRFAELPQMIAKGLDIGI
jgi:hypothetical protein